MDVLKRVRRWLEDDAPADVDLRDDIAAICDRIDELSNTLDKADQHTEKLVDRLELFEAGLVAVQELIDGSRGVGGLHLNGSEAEWDDLLEGGPFESWLGPFSKAIAEVSR